MNRSQILGAATNWLAFAATLIVSFFLTPYLIASVGPARYDVWCVAESVLAYFTLLDMGVAACLVRYVARHHALGDREPLNRMASSCLSLYSVAGLLAVLIGIPVLAMLAPRLEERCGHPGDILAFLILMLANVAATLPLSIFPSILDGLERFTAKSLVRMVFLTLRSLGIVVVVSYHVGFVALAGVVTLSGILEHLVMAILCWWYLPGLQFRKCLVDRTTLRQVRGYSVDAFLAMLAGRVTVQTGAIIIGLALPVGQVTIFATAARLIEYVKTLLRTITATLTPGVSAMEARGDRVGICRLFLGATRSVLYIVMPVNLGLWYFGKPFLQRWVPGVGADGADPLDVLAMTLTLGVAQSVASRLLYGLGRLRLFARMAMAEASLNLLFTLALVVPWGVEGVALAVAVPNLLFCVGVIVYTCRLIGVSPRDYARAWTRPLLASAMPLAIWAGVGAVSPRWDAIAFAILSGLLPYAMIVVLLEWRTLLTIVGKVRPTVLMPASQASVAVAPSTVRG